MSEATFEAVTKIITTVCAVVGAAGTIIKIRQDRKKAQKELPAVSEENQSDDLPKTISVFKWIFFYIMAAVSTGVITMSLSVEQNQLAVCGIFGLLYGFTNWLLIREHHPKTIFLIPVSLFCWLIIPHFFAYNLLAIGLCGGIAAFIQHLILHQDLKSSLPWTITNIFSWIIAWSMGVLIFFIAAIAQNPFAWLVGWLITGILSGTITVFVRNTLIQSAN